MKYLLTFLMALSLVNLMLTRPTPEDDGGTSEEPQTQETTGSDEKNGASEEPNADDASKPDDVEEKGDDDTAKKEDDGESKDGEGSEKSDKEKGEPKNDPRETYNKVIEQLDQIKVDNVEDGHERSELAADIQRYLRNPIVDVIGSAGDFSKIAKCFKSMVGDAKKAIEEDVKGFKECTAKKDSNAYQCSQDRSTVQDKIAKMSSKIASCVASNRS
ncbi:AAEL010228-PA [Aedes aegypti]|uniref:AAEL010228-PA n=2 Tax=Aedes aegypti TaxID=7159 RepID=Q16TI1_AEDAE|nr:putative 30 kDa allergen-like protein [Aedes aegypti]EAT37811.1 AAEL010228-PA [Aedes aegypti]